VGGRAGRSVRDEQAVADLGTFFTTHLAAR
jgi:hypothetical protein